MIIKYDLSDFSKYMFNDVPICPHCDADDEYAAMMDYSESDELEIECDTCGKIYICTATDHETYSTKI